MKLFRIFSALVISFAALVSFNASAQTVTPVSCTWVVISTSVYNGASYVTSHCKESNNNVVAAQYLQYRPNQATQCTFSPYTGIQNIGTCLNPSLTRTSNCPKSGQLIATGCANSFSSDGFGQFANQQCGACGIRFQTVGWTSQCPAPGQSPAGNPQVNVYCN